MEAAIKNDGVQAGPARVSDWRQLRWIADAYQQAQRVRIQVGEQIRAVAQGRDVTSRIQAEAAAAMSTCTAVEAPDAADLLVAIRKGSTDGPVPLLGRTYRRHWEMEEEFRKEMATSLDQHPAWAWLKGVKGVGPTLAGRLLARLDIQKADTISSFWAYCGLATVPGVEYRCDTCGFVVAFPVSYSVSGSHQRLDSKRQCEGKLRTARGPDAGVRVAQPKPQSGKHATYDSTAKQICYLIGTSFLKVKGPYEENYRRERIKLDREKHGWAAGRKHATALRKTEKLFLAHLWLVWREAEGLSISSPYSHDVCGHEGWIDPWQMTSETRVAAAPGEPPISDQPGSWARRRGLVSPRWPAAEPSSTMALRRVAT
jgi:hypothetical protein